MTVGLSVVAPVAPLSRSATRWRARSFVPKNSPPSPRDAGPAPRDPGAHSPSPPTETAGPATPEGAGPSDEALVRICQGDATAGLALSREDAFRLLVERYQERAFWISKGMVGNAEDARDVAQEAFLRVFRSVDRFDLKLKFYTWFYQIVVNLSIDHLRRSKKRSKVSIDELAEHGDGQVEAPHESPGTALERGEVAGRVQRVLDELPEKYRSVIVLRDLEGFDGKEVASIEGATHATVRWRLHKARQMFKDAWERIYGASP